MEEGTESVDLLWTGVFGHSKVFGEAGDASDELSLSHEEVSSIKIRVPLSLFSSASVQNLKRRGGRGELTSEILLSNFLATSRNMPPYVLSSLSTAMYQWKWFPSTGLATLLSIKKSSRFAGSRAVEECRECRMEDEGEREEGRSNLRAWTSWRRYNISSYHPSISSVSSSPRR